MKKSKFVALALVAVATISTNVSAQIYNTGIAGGGGTDLNWDLSWRMLSGGSSCLNTAYSANLVAAGLPSYGFQEPGTTAPGSTPLCSQYQNTSGNVDRIITNTPTPPWTANNATSSWIGAYTDGIQPFTPSQSAGFAPGDNSMRFVYAYSTGVLGTKAITGNLEWDNMLWGYQTFNAQGASLGFVSAIGAGWLSPAPQTTGAQKSYCRTGDGLGVNPTCSSAFSIGPVAGAARIEFYTLGDGRTDGFRVSNAVVPEPSTYALMAAGLAGLFAVSRRRRTA